MFISKNITLLSQILDKAPTLVPGDKDLLSEPHIEGALYFIIWATDDDGVQRIEVKGYLPNLSYMQDILAPNTYAAIAKGYYTQIGSSNGGVYRTISFFLGKKYVP